MIVRDVMNSKSDHIYRHPVIAQDHRTLSRWYAMETRVYQAEIIDDKLVKGDLWFTNELVFDLDYSDDDIHAEMKMNEAISKLRGILGMEMCMIRNKNEYSQMDIDRFFTKNGVVRLPKIMGCQMVYRLKESVLSQYVDSVELYKAVRLKITEIIGGDLNFRGHMFKCYHNTSIFDVTWQKNCDEVDLYEVGKKLLCPEDLKRVKIEQSGLSVEKAIDAIHKLPPFTKLVPDVTIPEIFIKYQRRLCNWYRDLNRYRNTWSDTDSKLNHIYWEKSSSRNVTLFNMMSSHKTASILSMVYEDVVNSDIFDQCEIREKMDEEEFESVRSNILAYRERNGNFDIEIEDMESKKLTRPFDVKYGDLCIIDLLKEVSAESSEIALPDGYGVKSVLIEGFDGSLPYHTLADAFIHCGLSVFDAIPSMMEPKSVEWLNSEFYDGKLGLDDLFHQVKNALFSVHWKLYHAIRQEVKRQKLLYVASKVPCGAKMSALEELTGLKSLPKRGDREELMLLKRFSPIAKRLSDMGLCKFDGLDLDRCEPISAFRQKLHCKNSDASALVYMLKKWSKWVQIQQLITSCMEKKCVAKHYFTFDHSHSLYGIMKDYIIYDDKFIIYDIIHFVFLIKSIYTIDNNYDNDYDGALKCLLILFYVIVKYDDYYVKKGVNYVMKNIIFDVETTGLEYGKTFILSMAAILWDDQTEKVEEKYMLFNWRKLYPLGTKLQDRFHIPESTQKVHGITEESLQTSKNSLPPVETFIEFDQWMKQDGKYPQVLVAFNSTFDINMIKSNLMYLVRKPEGEQLFDLLHLFDRIDGDFLSGDHPIFFDSMTYDIIFHYEHRGVKQRHNLEDVGLRYGLGENERAHDALYDTRRLFEIYRLQREEMESNGIVLDGSFEERLVKMYNRRQAQWKKTDNYLAIGCPELEG